MKRVLAAMTFLLAACATTSDVKSMGGDRYLISYEFKGDMPGWIDVKAAAVKKATDYCAGRGKKVDVLEVQSNEGVKKWVSHSADVIFRCT